MDQLLALKPTWGLPHKAYPILHISNLWTFSAIQHNTRYSVLFHTTNLQAAQCPIYGTLQTRSAAEIWSKLTRYMHTANSVLYTELRYTRKIELNSPKNNCKIWPNAASRAQCVTSVALPMWVGQTLRNVVKITCNTRWVGSVLQPTWHSGSLWKQVSTRDVKSREFFVLDTRNFFPGTRREFSTMWWWCHTLLSRHQYRITDEA